jgi:hypothetical protein
VHDLPRRHVGRRRRQVFRRDCLAGHEELSLVR